MYPNILHCPDVDNVNKSKMRPTGKTSLPPGFDKPTIQGR